MGLRADASEADERAAARALRDLRARVKAARALVSATPGLADTLARDWRKAAAFYARFVVTEAMFRNGLPNAGPTARDPGVVDEPVFEVRPPD